MSSPSIFGGSRTKILTSKGLLLKDGTPIDYNGPKNYITKGTFATNATTGWELKRTTLSGLIPNQVAASWTTPSVLTLSATTTGALTDSGYSLSLAASAATTAGDMLVSDAYTIDIEDQAKVLNFKFSYRAYANASNMDFSGTNSNTFHVYIYDVTNNAWIQPSGCYSTVQPVGVGIASGTFQTPYNMTQFRIALVSCNASAGAFTLYTDNFFVGPQYIQSAIMRNPVGTIITSASLTPPQGYLYCDGSAISRSQYSNLFLSIGTTYGSGNGSTTFNLPDLRGRVAVGKDNMGGTSANRMTTAGSGINGTTLGAAGGAQNHTLTGAQSGVPAHSHTSQWYAYRNDTWNAHVEGGAAGHIRDSVDGYGGGSNVRNISTYNNNAANASEAHNNTQPSIIVHYFICYDSGNVTLSSDITYSDDVGSVHAFAVPSASPPSGYLYADGSAVSRVSFYELFAKIGTTFGSGDGSTTFNVPDLRGIFVRGAGSQTIGAETYSATLGTKQNDATSKNGLGISDPGHSHTIPVYGSGGSGASVNYANQGGYVGAPSSNASTTGISLTNGDSETRPANIALTYFIKYVKGSTAQIAASSVVAARAVVASPTTVATSTNVKVPLVSATLDTGSIFNSASNRFINPVSGVVRVTAQLTYDTQGAGAYWAKIYKNGSEVETTFMNISTYTLSNYSTVDIEFLDSSKAGDYYEIYAYQTTGSNKSLVNCKATFERLGGVM